MWALLFSFSIPEVFTWLYSCQMCIFKKLTMPAMSHCLTILFFETSHVVGLSLLVYCVLPNVDPVQGIVSCQWVGFVPSILLLLSEISSDKKGSQRAAQITINIVIVLIQFGGSISVPVIIFLTSKKNEAHWTTWLTPIIFFLVSLGWWKNYVVEHSPIGQ